MSFLDLDFTYDVALLAVKYADMQEKTSRLNEHSKPTGLSFNAPKTKHMSINTTAPAPITMDGEPIGEVDDFVYILVAWSARTVVLGRKSDPG